MLASPSVSSTSSRALGSAALRQTSGGATHAQIPRVHDSVVLPTVFLAPTSWLRKNDFPVR